MAGSLGFVDERSRENHDPASRITLVGPGAIGSTVAALLYAAGHAITVCGRTPRDSIEVRPDDKEPIVVPGPVLTDPGDITESADVVLLAVKDTQNEQASAWLARLCDEHTVVCALENGVEQVERVGRYCPTSTVIPAAIWISAEPEPDGAIRMRTQARLVLPATDAAGSLADVFRTADVAVELDPDFITAAWHKLLVNAVVGMMVLTGRRSGIFRRDDIADAGARITSPNASRSRGPTEHTSAIR